MATNVPLDSGPTEQGVSILACRVEEGERRGEVKNRGERKRKRDRKRNRNRNRNKHRKTKGKGKGKGKRGGGGPEH